VATHIESFRKYQRQDAWTWEQMAISRARPIAGDSGLCDELRDEVAAILALPRDAAKVRREAFDMRKLIEEEKPPRDIWDIKLIPGGLIDLEFIAQVAVITGQFEGPPGTTATADVLAHLSSGYADAQVRQELSDAYAFYLAVTQMTRLCLTGAFDRNDVPPGLSDLLLAATDLPDFSVLEAHLKDVSTGVRKSFDHLFRTKRK